ncbi:ATP-binding protein [Pseudomonas sp. efr-133-TYG-5]|uniref:ATP-dependent nuclease n=1 Tax=Pseudomonas sp. efr-133-TYG-5 TaxID=3040310 RepID=UPI0025545B98|nr:ATP-binding protein [Pseudomonas sp. efr-133-TYG-5]
MHITSIAFEGLRKLRLNHNKEKSRAPTLSALAPKRINVIIGPNGGGKSTIVDIIRCCSDSQVLTHISRENIGSSTRSTFAVEFNDRRRFDVQFTIRKPQVYAVEMKVKGPYGISALTHDIIEHGTVPETLSTLTTTLNLKVCVRTHHDERDTSLPAFIAALNAEASRLVGLLAYPLHPRQSSMDRPDFDPDADSSNDTRDEIDEEAQWLLDNPWPAISITDEGLLKVFFNDDQMQPNFLPMTLLPSGWRAFGGLLGWLAEVPHGSICVIEEPETHLHPTLLRLLMRRLGEMASDPQRQLQLFITTHAPAMIDVRAWAIEDVALFEVDGFEARDLTEQSHVLSLLGVRPSDVSQANGVIWVEGASDKLYLLHWIDLLSQKNKTAAPKENHDYAFLPYGGSMLKHYSANHEAGLIDMFRINRNSFVVMDRDLDFLDASKPGGTELTKSRFLKDVASWLTQEYTMESYLPTAFFERYFSIVDGRVVKDSGYSKTDIAEFFREEYQTFDHSFKPGTDLPERISELLATINQWNQL